MGELFVMGLMILSGLILAGVLLWPERGLIWRWLHRRKRMERVLMEDALKYLYKCRRRDQTPGLESVAGMLSISMDRATEILDQTRQRGLVSVQGDQFALTESGRRIALQIIRAHRLWERYLADKTGFTEEEWHQKAEELEHHTSTEDADRLSARLGRPILDPHGDPIPSRQGELVDHGGQPLTTLEEGTLARVVHIEDEPEMVYAQIVAEGLHPHMTIRVDEKTDQRLRLWSGEQEFILAPMLAANLSVVPVPETDQHQDMRGVRLSDLKEGQEGEVLDISPRIRGLDRRRLLDLGVLPGTVIRAEMVSPGGDPTAYRIRDTLIALRQEQAQFIRVLPGYENGEE